MNIYKNWREPLSALTHFIALLFIIPIMILLIYKGYSKGGLSYAVPFSVFAVSMIALYLASTVYHMTRAKDSTIKLLKRIDHMMIFVLIAGTYTPICAITLKGNFGTNMLIVVWGVAIAGIVLKIFWITAPRWISTIFYIAMGWLSIFGFVPITNAINIGGVLLLILGGVIYTLGAIVYILKYPKLHFKHFGFHEIFHLFVIGGSACFVLFMFIYVL